MVESETATVPTVPLERDTQHNHGKATTDANHSTAPEEHCHGHDQNEFHTASACSLGHVDSFGGQARTQSSTEHQVRDFSARSRSRLRRGWQPGPGARYADL